MATVPKIRCYFHLIIPRDVQGMHKGCTRDVQGLGRGAYAVYECTLKKEFLFIFALKTNGDLQRTAACMKEMAN